MDQRSDPVTTNIACIKYKHKSPHQFLNFESSNKTNPCSDFLGTKFRFFFEITTAKEENTKENKTGFLQRNSENCIGFAKLRVYFSQRAFRCCFLRALSKPKLHHRSNKQYALR